MAPSPLLLVLALFPVVVIAGGNSRRRLSSNESIHRYLREENEAGNMQPKVTISAMTLDGADDDEDEFDIDLVQATAAVNSRTTYSIDGGPHLPVGDMGVKFLVHDRSPNTEDEGIAHMNLDTKPKTAFALISVDEDTETVNGIAKQQSGKAMNIQQVSGSTVVATPADEFELPKDFRCQVTHEHSPEGPRGRRIMEDGDFADGDHDTHEHEFHEHEHGHDHHHNHNHDHSHDHLFHGDSIEHLIEDISLNNHRRMTGFPSTPSHQVDLFIEIDRQFIAINGNDIQKALRYVNTIVTAASAGMFEAEVNTRLTVAHIAVNDNYDNVPNSRAALDKMRDIYSNHTSWHYNEGFGIDLHHAILGKRLNGGIAFIGSVCSPLYGYGVSPNIRGNFMSLDLPTMWDVSVFAHEVGHNFGAYHTFDRRGFKPPIDRCFIRSTDFPTCPTDAQLQGAATLMSYCDACPGANVASLAYTFGGEFVGDDPSNIDSWRNDPSLFGSFNKEPRRVPKAMYDHVSSRTCTQPNFTCEKDSDCYDWGQCTIDRCNLDSGQCEHETRENCCGNGICELGELPCSYGECQRNAQTCEYDCGPYNLETKQCQQCNARKGRGNGLMVDIQSLSSGIVLVNSLEFRHTATKLSTVTIYTADGNFHDIATTPEEWVIANTTDVKIGGRKGGYATVIFEVPIAINPGTTRTFYIASTGKLISGIEQGGDDMADKSLSIKNEARIVGTPFGGGLKGKWDGKVNYSIYVIPSLF